MRIENLFSLIINDLNLFYIKLFLIPTLVFFILYLIYMINLKFTKPKDSIIISSKVALLNSILQIIFIYNIIFFFIIKYNGLFVFKWSNNNYRSNILFMLLPFILPYLILILLYFRTEKNIRKNI